MNKRTRKGKNNLAMRLALVLLVTGVVLSATPQADAQYFIKRNKDKDPASQTPKTHELYVQPRPTTRPQQPQPPQQSGQVEPDVKARPAPTQQSNVILPVQPPPQEVMQRCSNDDLRSYRQMAQIFDTVHALGENPNPRTREEKQALDSYQEIRSGLNSVERSKKFSEFLSACMQKKHYVDHAGHTTN